MNEYERKKKQVLGWSTAIFIVVGFFLVKYMMVQGDFNFSVDNSFIANVIRERGAPSAETSTPQAAESAGAATSSEETSGIE